MVNTGVIGAESVHVAMFLLVISISFNMILLFSGAPALYVLVMLLDILALTYILMEEDR